jgi:hypothetical protein
MRHSRKGREGAGTARSVLVIWYDCYCLTWPAESTTPGRCELIIGQPVSGARDD